MERHSAKSLSGIEDEMGNLATNLRDTAGQYPLYPACRGDGDVLSYADLDDLSARVAGGLLAHGLRAGDTVALALPLGPTFAVLYYGALRIGAVVAPIATGLPPHGVRRHIDACGARLLFASEALETPPDSTTPGSTTPGSTTPGSHLAVGRDFLDQLAFWPQHADIVYRDDADAATVHFATGPAGEALRVLRVDHGTLRAQAFETATGPLDLDPGDVVLGCRPTAADATVCCLNATVLAGACLLIPDGVRPPADGPDSFPVRTCGCPGRVP